MSRRTTHGISRSHLAGAAMLGLLLTAAAATPLAQSVPAASPPMSSAESPGWTVTAPPPDHRTGPVASIGYDEESGTVSVSVTRGGTMVLQPSPLAQPGVRAFHQEQTAGSPSRIPIGVTGRHVRVQLTSGTDPLSLAEVEILGGRSTTTAHARGTR